MSPIAGGTPVRREGGLAARPLGRHGALSLGSGH